MMQKFSSISGEKVNTEPKVEISQESLEVESFRQSILDLIEKTLSVRNEGSYKHAMIVSKIDGKEMFVEALMDFLSEKENKKAITYLESLKESNGDWKSIDDKILQIQTEIDNTNFLNENTEHVEQIKSFLEKYSLSDDFNEILETQINRITDFNTANLRAKVAEVMLQDTKYSKLPKGRLRSISYKFAYRANQIK
jgi:hypothetical protein